MLSKKTISSLVTGAIALTVAGSAAAAGLNAPANPNLIKVGNHGCQGKNGCQGKSNCAAKEDVKAAAKGEKEKCYGVVKAGHNDCGNAAKTHSCAGHAATDGDAGEWLLLPTGVCDKLVGGSTKPPKS